MVNVDFTSLIDIVKGLISKHVVEILNKHGLYTNGHCVTVFCNKATVHGDLSIRKEFLMSVLKNCCNNNEQLKVVTWNHTIYTHHFTL